MLLGSEQPRIFTPPLRELLPEVDGDGVPAAPATTLGFECIEFAEDGIGVELFPWERWFLVHALELLADGSLRFRQVILLVARQNGKTTILKILALFWMYVLGRPLVIGTAQNLDVAEETWSDTVDLAEAVEELSVDIKRVDRGAGKKTLRLKTGERYKIAATNRGGGRGLSGDLIEMDELREHHNWESWAAVSNTTMAISSALVVAASNAGDLLSVVLRLLRFLCMSDPRTIGVTEQELSAFGRLPTSDDEPDDMPGDTIGIFEWSAAPECGIWDREGWAAANPSLGHTITDTAMAANARIASMGGEAEWVYRIENLCQWRPTAGGGPFPAGAWDGGLDPASAIADGSRLSVCVDVSHDRGLAHVAVAGFRPDGNVHVEVIASRAGTEWVLPWLIAAERPGWDGVTAQTNGAPVSSILGSLKASKLTVVDWAGADLSGACGGFWDLVRPPRKDDEDDAGKRRVFHLPQPVLDVPAATAVMKPLGDGWVFDRRKSPVDCAPLMAVTGAAWLLTRPQDVALVPRVRVIGG